MQKRCNDPENVHSEEQKLVEHFGSEKRKAEFLTGRSLYHQLEARLSVHPQALLKDEQGRPKWPEQVTGSITHSGEWVAILLGLKTEPCFSVGLDLQEINIAKTRHGIRRHILTTEEERLLEQQIQEQPEIVLYLFSAKEALYKALNPITQLYLGFKEVNLIHLSKNSFHFQLLQKETRKFLRTDLIQVDYQTSDQFILSSVQMSRLDFC